jgi:hypothetical protein
MAPSICLGPLYPSLLTEDKIPRVAAAGFRHVEFWGWRDKEIPAIEAACRKHDVHIENGDRGRSVYPLIAFPFQELVVEGAERQRVADCGVGRAGSPSRPVVGWQPGSRRSARRCDPTTPLQSRTRHPKELAFGAQHAIR